MLNGKVGEVGMNVTAMFECRTAEQIEVNSKMYCKGHETKYGGKEIGEPLDRCQHCRQWIGNRKVLKPGKYGGLTVKEW